MLRFYFLSVFVFGFLISNAQCPSINSPQTISVCSGTAFSFSPSNGGGNVVPSGTTYTWTVPGNANINGEGNQAVPQSSIGQTLSQSTNSQISISYTVTPVLGACVTSSFTLTVTVNPIPTVNPISSQTLCAGASTTAVNFSSTFGDSGTTYNWSNSTPSIGLVSVGSGNISSFTSLNTTNTNSVGTITVTPTANGCPGSPQQFTITVKPIPTVNSISSQSLCAGVSTTAVNFSSTFGDSGTTYNWSNSTPSIGLVSVGSGNISSFASLNSTNTNSVGAITVTPTANGCPGSPQQFTITVKPTPDITSNLQQTICSEQPFTFTPENNTNGIVPDNTTLTWTVSNSNVIGEIDNNTNGLNALNQTLTNLNYANNQVVYTVIPTANSCVGNAFDYTVTVLKAPRLLVTPTSSICAGISFQLFAIDSLSSGQLFYNWSNGSTLNNSYIFNPIATPVSTTTYSVSVTDNTTQCQVSRNVIVNVSSLPTATITFAGSNSICQGNSVALNANAGPGLTYQWKLNDINIPNATTSSYLAASSGTYSVVVSNANGCSKTSSGVSVNVNPIPVADISSLSATTFCEGASAILATTNVVGNSYQWKLNGNNIPNATSSNYNAIGSGSYSVVVNNTTTQCVSASPVLVITVNPLPSAIISPILGSICQGNSLQLSANTGVGLSYQWRHNDVAISGATNSSYSANSVGVYSVVVTNGYGCTKSSSGVSVNVNPLPIADVSSLSATTFCEGESAILATTNVAGNSYQWKLNGNSISGANLSSYEANLSGNYSVQVTNSNSCSLQSPSVNITVHSLSSITVSADDTNLCSGESTALHVTGASNYSWTPASLVSNSSNANPSVFPTATTNFGVTGTDQNGCSSYEEILITVLENPLLDLPPSVEVCAGSSVSLPGMGSIQWTGITSTSDFNASQSGYAVAYLQDAELCSSTDSIYIQVNPLPLPSISGSLEVCANSTYSEYQVASTGNLFSWNVSNGELQGVENGNTAFIHWFDLEYGPSTFVTVIEHDIHSGCENSDTLFVNFTGLAPSITNVSLLYPNGSTLFSEDHFAIMNWGSTIISNNVDEYTDGHAQYYTYENFDTALRYYWIEAGDDSLCLTRSYFNAPVWEVTVQELGEDSFVQLFPNPTSDVLNLITDTKHTISGFSIYDCAGHLVKQEFNFKNQSVIDVSQMQAGFYVLRLNAENGNCHNQTFIKK